MFKNQGSQKIAVFAWDAAAGSAKTGDAANITAQISKDGGACAASNDVNPTELDAADAPGTYLFDAAQAESNADLIVFQAASSTSDIEFRPIYIYTQTVMRGTDSANTTVPDAAGIAAALHVTTDAMLTIIEKMTGHNVTRSGFTITIYEADGTTVWRQYDLTAGGRIKL